MKMTSLLAAVLVVGFAAILTSCGTMSHVAQTGYAIGSQAVNPKTVATPDGQVETDLTRVAGNMVLLADLPDGHRLYYIVQDEDTRILTRWELTRSFLGQPFGKVIHKTILMKKVSNGWMLVDILNPNATKPTPVARPYVYNTEREAFEVGKKDLYFLP